MTDLAERVMTVLRKRVPKQHEIGPSTPVEELGLDSLEVIEGVFALEEEFGIRVELNDEGTYTQFATVNDIVLAVQAEIAKKR